MNQFWLCTQEDGWSEGHSFIAPIPPQLPERAAPGSGSATSVEVPQAVTILAFNDVAMTNPLLFNDFWAGACDLFNISVRLFLQPAARDLSIHSLKSWIEASG